MIVIRRTCRCSWFVFLGLVAAWAYQADAGCGPPSWWDDPNPGTSVVIYEPGSAANCRTEAEARQKAHEAGLDALRRQITVDSNLWPHLELAETDIAYPHVCKDGLGRWHAWVLVSYPRDRFDALLKHVQEGPLQYSQAVELAEQRNYPEALTQALQLVAEYPVGKQVFFRTERALLLASDCYVALGQPRKAVQICESILAGSEDPASRQETENRLAAIRTDYTNILIRGAFNNKRMVVRCVQKVAPQAESWGKMKIEIKNLVIRSGGQVIDADTPLSDAGDYIVSPQEASNIMSRASADGLLLFVAHGEISNRNNDANKTGSVDFQFSGTTSGFLFLGGQEPYLWERSVLTGWNPVSTSMCMDVLALNVLNVWQSGLVKHMDELQ